MHSCTFIDCMPVLLRENDLTRAFVEFNCARENKHFGIDIMFLNLRMLDGI